MDLNTAKIAVIGAGAIGGITAAFIREAGLDPVLVCKRQNITDVVLTRGLHITGVRGEHHIAVRAVTRIADLDGPQDLILLATKATDCIAAARELLPFVTAETTVVSMQNGISEDKLAEVLGREKVIGCVVGWGASHKGPGGLEVTSDGEFVIGNIDGQPDERLPVIRELLEPVNPTRISDNIMGELYSKLIINSCINALGVIGGVRLGQLLSIRKVRRIFIELIREFMAVAHALKLTVEPGGGGKLDYYRFLEGDGGLASLRRHLTLRVIGFKYRRIRSSSLQSIERGRRTEIDFLNGYISDRGAELGVPTPLNDAVIQMVRDIEGRKRFPSLQNLEDPVFTGV